MLAATLSRRVDVATCIACGARTRHADCEGGCADVALALVEASAVDALSERVSALELRVEAALETAWMLAGDDHGSLESIAQRARAALRHEVPPAQPAADVVDAWGCPDCGRVDAPQPCLGICIRLPVSMTDAREYEQLREAEARLDQLDDSLTSLVSFAAHVRPAPGKTEQTRAALAARAHRVLTTQGGPR